jgi:hypothetical protein
MTEGEEHARLSWKLIEWKVAYYRPDSVHPSRLKDYEVSDDDYGAAEVRYLTLCRKLGLCNSLVHKGWPGFVEDMYEARYSYPGGKPMGPMMGRSMKTVRQSVWSWRNSAALSGNSTDR